MAEEFLGQYGEYTLVSLKHTRWSWVAYFARRHERPRYCLKVRRAKDKIHEGRQITTAHEYETLSLLHNHFSGVAPFERSVPRPVAHLAECYGVLMECVPGQSLASRLRWRGNVLGSLWSTRHLHSLFRTSGVWLRACHAVDQPDWMPVRTSGMETLQRRAYDAVAQMPDALLRNIPLERLLDSIPSSLGYQPHLVFSHGDYLPGNVLFSDGEIRVIDLTGACLTPAEYDLSKFLIWTASQKQRVLVGKLAGTSALWGSLAATFLTAYGYNADDVGSRLGPFLVVQFLERLAHASGTVEGLPTPFRLLSRARISLWAKAFATSLVEGRLD